MSLGGGLDTKTDAISVPAGKALALENAVFTSPQSLHKRPGYAALGQNVGSPPTATLTVGQALAAYYDELLAFDKANVYSWNATDASWLSKGAFVSCNVTQEPIIRNSYQQTQQDGTTHPLGLQAYAWEDSQGGSRYSVIDSATGQVIVPNSLILATAVKPKVVSIGNFIVILYVNTADSRLYAAAISISAPSAALAPVAITSAAGNPRINSTSPNYDAAVVNTSGGQQLYVAYNDMTPTTGGVSTFAATSATPTTFGAVTSVLAEAASVVTVFGDSFKQGPVIAWWNGTAIKYKAYSADFGTSYGTGTIETLGTVVLLAGASTSSTALALRFFYSQSAAAKYNYLTRQNTVTGAYVVGTPGSFRRSAAVAGKAFVYNGIAYVPLAYESPLQPTYFVADHTGNLIAKMLYAQGGGIPVRASLGASMLPESVAANGSIFRIALLAKGNLSAQSGAVFTLTGVEAVTLNLFDTQNSYLRTLLGSALHLSGGFVSMYDGISPVEHGFHLFPEPVTVATSTSGGLITAGTYQYVVVYAWTDNQGQIHRSAGSVQASQVTTGATSSNTLTIPTLRLTAKQGTRAPVVLEVYRTQSNTTTFYLISSITAPTLNDPTVDTVSFVDTLADTAIQGNALLYTTGGVVENIAPGPASSLTVHRNRVFALDTTDGSFWYSKQVVPGAPVEFSDLFKLNVDPRGGMATAGTGMDDKLIVFKANSLFFFAGQGPDATGNQNDFSDSIFITSDVGCTNPRSIVTTPLGLMFQSAKGIYLLDRSLQVSYVGAPVEAYNGQQVTSAQLIPSTNQVRFTLATGVALVFDYFMQQWSVFTNVNAVDSTIWHSLFTGLNPYGKALQETPGAFSDAGAFVSMRIVTAWLQFAGIQGFQRVYKALLLGRYLSPHKLRVQVAYDFDPTPLQEDYVTPVPAGTYGGGSLYGGGSAYGGATMYEWRIFLQKQKCAAVQFTIEDVSTGTAGESMSLSALGLEVGLKGRLRKMPAASSVG